MSSPPPKSLVPAPTMPTVWPPSNPSGTVIPFPLPWGQTGCCPPGGMDALMKCYCDLQQASAFIGQVMLDQINNNPAMIAAIIAGIEASGSTLPTLGVTNGANAQPGQVGECQFLSVEFNVPAGTNTQVVVLGSLTPGDWDCEASTQFGLGLDMCGITLSPVPAGTQGFSDQVFSSLAAEGVMVTPIFRILSSVPSLIAWSVATTNPGAAGNMILTMMARRMR